MSFYREFLQRVDLEHEIPGATDPQTAPAAWLGRSTWITHALNRLAVGAIEYEDAPLSRPPMELLEQIAEEAADLGAWAAITQKVIDGRDDIDDELREHIGTALRGAAFCGAHAWAHGLSVAMMLAGSEEPNAE
jgi:hypothetical protein